MSSGIQFCERQLTTTGQMGQGVQRNVVANTVTCEKLAAYNSISVGLGGVMKQMPMTITSALSPYSLNPCEESIVRVDTSAGPVQIDLLPSAAGCEVEITHSAGLNPLSIVGDAGPPQVQIQSPNGQLLTTLDESTYPYTTSGSTIKLISTTDGVSGVTHVYSTTGFVGENFVVSATYDNNAPAAVTGNGKFVKIPLDFGTANLAALSTVDITLNNSFIDGSDMVMVTQEGLQSGVAPPFAPAVVNVLTIGAGTAQLRIFNISAAQPITNNPGFLLVHVVKDAV
jgi:hypothetical protein